MMVGFAAREGSGAWHGFAQGWVPIMAIVAALSAVIGNPAAIAQSSVRRWPTPAVAHAGYALVGVLANQKSDGLTAEVYCVTTYAR